MPRNVQSAVWVERITGQKKKKKMNLTSSFCGTVTVRADSLYGHISSIYTCKQVTKHSTVTVSSHWMHLFLRPCTASGLWVAHMLRHQEVLTVSWECPLFPFPGIYSTANNNSTATPKSSHRENLVFLKASQIYQVPGQGTSRLHKLMVFSSIRGRRKQPWSQKRKVPLPRVSVWRGTGKPVLGACARAGNQGVCRGSGTSQGKGWNPSESLRCPLSFPKDLNTPKAWTWTSSYLAISPPSPASKPEEQDGLQGNSSIHLIYKAKTKRECENLCLSIYRKQFEGTLIKT